MFHSLRLALALSGCLSLAITGCSQKNAPATSGTAAGGSQASRLQLTHTLSFDSVSKWPSSNAMLSGSGTTLGDPLYTELLVPYRTNANSQLKYAEISPSKSLVKALRSGNSDFVASDIPFTAPQLAECERPVLHVPTALAAVSVCYNIPALQQAKLTLKLTGENLAAIFSGQVTRWNDPSLVANNPQLGVVDQAIITVHRLDGAGTTYVFTDYLSVVDANWARKLGKTSTATWPVGCAAEKNAGVAQEIKTNEYSIGYLDLNAAEQNSLPSAAIRNSAGNFVEPSPGSISAAAAGFQPAADLRFSLINTAGKGAYPICTATWIICYQTFEDQSKVKALSRLLWWLTHDGQVGNEDLKYAPLPPAVVARCEEVIKSMNTAQPPAAGK